MLGCQTASLEPSRAPGTSSTQEVRHFLREDAAVPAASMAPAVPILHCSAPSSSTLVPSAVNHPDTNFQGTKK